MLKIVKERIKQKYRTGDYPVKDPVLSPRYRGRPAIDALLCSPANCAKPCLDVCPSGALTLENGQDLCLDLGRCTFCGRCAALCRAKAIKFGPDWRLASSSREGLYVRPVDGGLEAGEKSVVQPLPADLRRIFGRSLRLRQVSAAGCNACEADINVLGTLVFDMARFGIDIVASPRHADAMIITGTLPRNMRLAAQKAFNAIPEPSLVIACGACAISGGLFAEPDNPAGQNGNGVDGFFQPNLFIPGCPPHPYTILDGMLRLLGRVN